MTNKMHGAMRLAERHSKFLFGMLVVLMASTACLLNGCSSASDEHETAALSTPKDVRLTPAQRQRIHIHTVTSTNYHRTIQTAGIVDFDNDQATSVLAPISGPVSRLLVSLGDKVKKGQVLAQVDSPDFSAAIGAYRKALSAANTSRRLADLDADLVKHHGVSRREAAQAATDAVSAEADRDAARQALIALNIPLATIKDIEQGKPVAHLPGAIRAPIAGTVVEKSITPGQLLQAGTTPCFTVADLSRMWVNAQVFGADVASVSTGDSADVETGTGSKDLSGKVTNVSASVDADTRAVTARVVVNNPGDVLKKQMYVRVAIRSQAQSSGVMVPVSAILRDDENLPFVYVVQPDGGYARRRVTLGYRSGDQYTISNGLKAAEQIVADGGLFVQFMQTQ